MLSMDNATELENQPPFIACDVSPFTPDQREHWVETVVETVDRVNKRFAGSNER